MPPNIPNSTTWQQAEILMQPAFIRIVDNIRKHLDTSKWKGSYHDVLIWPAGTTDETKSIVIQLLEDSKNATAEDLLAIKQKLALLPIPHPGYHLRLQYQEQVVNMDLWDLCYQVCFVDYSPENVLVDIDTNLLDEFGEVDWQYLESKTKGLVQRIFDNLIDRE